MLKTSRIIGLSGVAGSGKDSFCKLLGEKIPVKRLALADSLKLELAPFFQKTYGVDIFTCERKTKDLLRPILVAHGKFRRQATNGRHWIELLITDIRNHQRAAPEDTIVVTDVRYDEFLHDEVSWLKESGGVLVHIARYGGGATEKTFVAPANEDEALNDPRLRQKANYRVEWPTVKNTDGIMDGGGLSIYVDEFLKYLRR